MMRGQTTLPAVAIALVVLTAVTTLSVAMADSAISRADRTPEERRVAASVADRLVAADGPLAGRANVLNSSRVSAFDGSELEAVAPAATDHDVEVRLDEEAIATSGDPDGGTTIHRIALHSRATSGRLEPDGRRVTVPRRATAATITLSAASGVRTVRANDRVVLHNDGGLDGTFEVSLSRYETTTLRFQTAGTLSEDAVSIEYETPQTTKATLSVTVDV